MKAIEPCYNDFTSILFDYLTLTVFWSCVVCRHALFTFSNSPLKPLNGIQRNLRGSKISTTSTKFVFFGPIWKTRWPLIDWDIFHFSDTAAQNSTKLDRRQYLDILYQVWGAAVAECLSSWVAEQEDRGSIPGIATWIFRDWLSPASKSRYGWKIAKSTLILKTTNQPIYQVCVFRGDRQ